MSAWGRGDTGQWTRTMTSNAHPAPCSCSLGSRLWSCWVVDTEVVIDSSCRTRELVSFQVGAGRSLAWWRGVVKGRHMSDTRPGNSHGFFVRSNSPCSPSYQVSLTSAESQQNIPAGTGRRLTLEHMPVVRAICDATAAECPFFFKSTWHSAHSTARLARIRDSGWRAECDLQRTRRAA
jgi:hypothetical protein